MSKKPPDETTRKTIALPNSLWSDINDYRFDRRITTEVEALRRLLVSALKAEGYSGSKPTTKRTKP